MLDWRVILIGFAMMALIGFLFCTGRIADTLDRSGPESRLSR
jgi:hypothetical protein